MLRKIMIITFAMTPMVLAGCSSVPFGDRFGNGKAKKEAAADAAALIAKPEIPAQSLLNAGVRNINTGDHKRAQKAFAELGKQHPFSKEAERSLVLSAFSHYSEAEYDKTVSTAERFIQLYPGSTDAAYMQYLIGESHFKQVSSILLDQEDTRKGLRAYSNLIRLYPESKYVEDSKTKIIFMNDQLAGKEMQVGRYYQEKNQHLAAVNRFRGVAENFQKTRHIEESLYRLTESYLALGIVNEAQTAGALLGYNYPESEWYKDAYSLLSGRKLEPSFNPRSRLRKILPFSGKKKPQSVPVATAPVIPNNQSVSSAVGASAPVVFEQAVPNTSNAAAAAAAVVTPEQDVPALAAASVQPVQSAGIVEADSLQAATEVASAKKTGFKRFIPFVGKKN
ncbi:MAG: outer membrane protein assembly factor BamD [Hyphomicrobiales bacterium]